MEYFSFGVFISIFIFILVLIGGIKYCHIYIPLIFTIILLLLNIGNDTMSGFDLLYLIIFTFSRIIYILFDIINKVFQNKSFNIDLLILLGMLFFYLFGHIMLTKYLLNKKIKNNYFIRKKF